MITKCLIGFCLIGLISSCTKDKGEMIIYDDIEYFQFDDKSVLNTVTTTTTIYYGLDQGVVCLPLDTASSLKISFHPSDEFTFTFYSSQHYYPWRVGVGLDRMYEHFLQLESKDSIAGVANHNAFCSIFSKTDIVDKGVKFLPWLSATMYYGTPYSHYPDIYPNFTKGDFFLGFKRHRSDGIHYGWIRYERLSFSGIKIKDAAYNKTPYRKIQCGQTQ